MRRLFVLAGVALAASGPSAGRPAFADVAPDHYRPQRATPAALQAALDQLEPGRDAFPEEKTAAELASRLDELGRAFREGRLKEVAAALFSPALADLRLVPESKSPVLDTPALQVTRFAPSPGEAKAPPVEAVRALESFAAGLGALRVAEMLITGLTVEAGPEPASAATDVRYDFVGKGAAGGRAERVGRWRLGWRREAGSWRVASWSAQDAVESRAPRPVFVEATDEALGAIPAQRAQLGRGMDEWLSRLDATFLPGGMGHHGVAVGDADGDGLDDLYVCQPAGLPNRLFRNLGDGTFEDVTEAAGLLVLDSTAQALFADVDNDADQDLVLVTRGGLLLFQNDGRGRFASVKDAFTLKEPLRGSPTSASLADYDRDGFLDLYLCTYSFFIGASEDKAGTPTPYHDATNGPPNVLFRNDGRGRFVDATRETGMGANNDRFSFAAAWGDYDGDGWPDLLVANDFGRKNLYRNLGRRDGKVAFEDAAERAGVLDFGAGMSASFFDYDDDGRLDLYAGNMWSAAGLRVTALPGFKPEAPAEVRALYRRHARGNSLFRNRGDGTFDDVTLAAHAEMGRWAWSSDALDFDLDGSLDLYVVNGMFTRGQGEEGPDLDSFFWRQVTAASPLDYRRGTPFDDAWRATNRMLAENAAQASHERNVFLRNDGRGGFDDVSGTVGLDLDQDGRSFAVFDHDGDGDPDLAVMAPRSAPQLRLFRNTFAGSGARLVVRLAGTKSNRDAVGARVVVETDVLRRTRFVTAGSGFLSQHTKDLLFGLGASTRIRKVEVTWPDGETQTFAEPPLGHRLLVEEGRTELRMEALAPAREVGMGPVSVARTPPRPAANESGGTWFYRPYPAPDFTVTDLTGAEHTLSRTKGRPVLLLFWSLEAANSLAALDALAAAKGPLGAATVIALSVDEASAEAKVRARAPAGLTVGLAGRDVAGTYSVLSRFLFDRREDLRLPTLFLLDARGEVVKVYRGRIDAAELALDLPKIEASSVQRLARALPFPGTFFQPPAERNYFQVSLDLAEQGYEAAALEGFERAARLDPSAITFYNLGTLRSKKGQAVEARTAFERALKLDPRHAEAANSLGALLAQGDELEAAINHFRAALESRPDFPDALNNLGYALFQTGAEQEPFDLYQQALKLQPEFPEAYNNLGIYFGEQGDLVRAEGYFRLAVEKRPGYGEAASNLALVMASRGDRGGAVTVLDRLLQENPGFERGYLTLCRVYVESGRRREGVQALERLLQRNPRHAEGLALLRQLRTGGGA